LTATAVDVPLMTKTNSADLWAAAGLLVGIASSRWADRDEEEEEV
jgi:hypothetical protein